MRDRHTSVRGRLAAAAAAVATITGGVVVSVRAFNPQPGPPGRWGMFGITNGQVARLSIVNTSGDPGGVPPDPCRAQLTFVDGAGRVLKQSAAVLKPGQATFLDLDAAEARAVPGTANDAAAAAGGRVEVRARVRVATSSDDPGRLPPDPCLPSLQVFFARSGRTAFVVPEGRIDVARASTSAAEAQ
ncbi:MAG: hypothetical protein ACREBE_28890 [bacterium]